MKAAIENFAKMQGENKILLLGAMMELGDDSKKEHEYLVKLIGKHPWKFVVLVGDNFREIKSSYLHFDSAFDARDWLKNQNPQNAQILIKGSRSMQMEKVLDID